MKIEKYGLAEMFGMMFLLTMAVILGVMTVSNGCHLFL